MRPISPGATSSWIAAASLLACNRPPPAPRVRVATTILTSRTATSSTPSPRTPGTVLTPVRGERFGMSTSGVSLLGFVKPPEATNTGPGFNRGSGGGARDVASKYGKGHMRVQRGVISYSPRCLCVIAHDACVLSPLCSSADDPRTEPRGPCASSTSSSSSPSSPDERSTPASYELRPRAQTRPPKRRRSGDTNGPSLSYKFDLDGQMKGCTHL